VHRDTDAYGDLRVRDRPGEHRRSYGGGNEQLAKSCENRHNLPPEVNMYQ
jgi:hypothetical protein